MSYSTTGLPTTNLQPGATGPQVVALQKWLVANGLMTQQQMNTGPGIYGPQTTAAVASLQSKLGVDNSTGVGYFGPRTIAGVQQAAAQTPQNGAGGATAPGSVAGASTSASGAGTTPTPAPGSVTSNINVPSTGNANLDQIQTALTGLANNLVSTGYSIPADLQITPAIVSQFLNMAHAAVDPYTQQLISSELSNVNANLAAQGTNFQNTQAETEQQFGTDLANEQDTAGGNGTAFSGQRNVNELNLQNTANRTLGSNAATAAYNIGSAARTSAANVGSANAANILLPSLSTGSVSLAGGQRGTTTSGPALSYNYDPSIYTVGTIPSNAAGNVNAQQQSYLSQYGTLAGAQSNSGRSVSDLMGMLSGVPSGYQIPSSLT